MRGIPNNSEVYNPGRHSYNAARRHGFEPEPRNRNGLSFLRALLLLIGIACLGYYGYTAADQWVYQGYENWAFDQQIAGHGTVTLGDYVRSKLGFSHPFSGETAAKATGQSHPETSIPPDGSVIGRVSIERLKISAVVRQGVDTATLRTAVGHVPSTALAGQDGNFAIAAHRDTLFRGLKDIEKGDLISFESPAGTYSYQVEATKIVKPSDVSVLQPDGGGLIQPSGSGSPQKLLTMITCYPFYYVGAAPKRFIVEAKLVESASRAALSNAN